MAQIQLSRFLLRALMFLLNCHSIAAFPVVSVSSTKWTTTPIDTHSFSSRQPLLLHKARQGNSDDDVEKSKESVSAEPEDPFDPRVVRRLVRKSRQGSNKSIKQQTSSSSLRQAKIQVQKQRNASAAFDLPEQPLVKTIGGGSGTIFQMAQQMWKQEKRGLDTKTAPNNRIAGFFPRWRPTPTQTVGISNTNPDFRTKVPDMNDQGYASTIWRNVRKRKPSLWRYALRTYERMGPLTSTAKEEKENNIQRANIHHHGAMLAAAKLGQWEKALEIYRHVETRQTEFLIQSGNSPKNNKWKLPVHVTDDMVVCLVYACVRASRNMSSEKASMEERRRPLDEASRILLETGQIHDICVEARHYNPLAAAYQHLRLRKEANALLFKLKDRQIGPEPETGAARLNVFDISAKDKGSYTLLVNGAVQEEDWVGAVDALRNMTEAGLYPNQRHLNAWTEVSERKTKRRTTRSWKKKRDELWIEKGLR